MDEAHRGDEIQTELPPRHGTPGGAIPVGGNAPGRMIAPVAMDRRSLIPLLLLLAGIGAGCVPGRFIARQLIQAPNSFPDVYTPAAKVVLNYTNHPVQSLPELFVPLGDPPVPIHCRFVEPGDYGFRTTDHWETDGGRPVLKFGMEAVVPAKHLRSAPPRGTVLILHGYALNKTVMAPWGFFLAEQGYRCVLVDLRGHGRSGGRQIHFGPVESRDMTELLTGLARLGHITGPVGVLGDSYGAAIALRWAADDPRVRTVVAMAPYARLSTAMEGIRATYARWVPATWVQTAAKELPGLLAERGDALDTTSIAGRIRVPVLFVAGGRDVVAPVGDVRELQRSVVADSKVVVLDEAIHESLPYDFQRLGPVVRGWFEERLR